MDVDKEHGRAESKAEGTNGELEDGKDIFGEGNVGELEGDDVLQADRNTGPIEDGEVLEPYVGMEFESEEAARNFYIEYAKKSGFVVRIMQRRRSEIDGRTLARRLGCNKQGFSPNLKGTIGPDKKPRPSAREGCKATILVKMEKSGKWVVTRFVKDHNHPLVVPATGFSNQVSKVGNHGNLGLGGYSEMDSSSPIEMFAFIPPESFTLIWGSSDIYSVHFYGSLFIIFYIWGHYDASLIFLSNFGTSSIGHYQLFNTKSDKDKKIEELTLELQHQDQLCTAYRQKLLNFLASIDEQGEQLSSKIQDVVENVRNAEAELQKLSHSQ